MFRRKTGRGSAGWELALEPTRMTKAASGVGRSRLGGRLW